MRQVLSAQGASRGQALGRARVRQPHALVVAEERIAPEQVDAELQRLHAAIDVVREEMRALRQRLHGALAHEVGEFLDLHALLLDDPELLAGLDDLIRQGLYGADYALRLQRDRIAAVFFDMDDAYLRARRDDVPRPRRQRPSVRGACADAGRCRKAPARQRHPHCQGDSRT